jgi:hypothetical protein
MSHFLAYVLIPANTDDVELKVVELLAPYDEDLAVEPHEKECVCVRFRAFRKAQELCSLRYGPVKAAEEEFNKLIDRKPDAPNPLEWAHSMKERNNFMETEVEKQIPITPPDPDCEKCGGKGVVRSTYNENGKWDWWEIGGRWDDILKDSWKDESHHDLNGKPALLSDLNKDNLPTPFAIITPDGAWHAQAELGWLPRIAKLDEEWEPEVQAILSEHEDCFLIVVDFHAV